MKCAYCGIDKKCTREHIIPNGFIKKMNMEEQITWNEASPKRVIDGHLVIKDVCAECNNGVLSDLDGYALNLITKYNCKIVKNTKKVYFKCNYNMLARWILKVCYNSARANKREYDIRLYKQFINYIKNGGETTNKILIYLNFMGLESDSKNINYYHLNKKSKYSIDFFRIAPFAMRDKISHYFRMRIILINSFAFLLVVFDEQVDECYIDDIKKSINKMKYNFMELETNGKLKLKKDYNLWKDSIITSKIGHKGYLIERSMKEEHIDFIEFELTKEELINKDYTRLIQCLIELQLNKDNVIYYYQKLIIHVSGYDDDPRELYCINEFIEYMEVIVEKYCNLIWFINLQFEHGIFFAIYFAYMNKNHYTNIDKYEMFDKNRMNQFIINCFSSVNNMLNQFAIDRSYNDKFTELLIDTIKKH